MRREFLVFFWGSDAGGYGFRRQGDDGERACLEFILNEYGAEGWEIARYIVLGNAEGFDGATLILQRELAEE